jgi:aminoglycoside phosphotransferase (APT) family kinase protein
MSAQVVHEVVDFAALTRWMDDQQVGQGPIEDIASLQGGTQNLLFRFRRGQRAFVLRRPPEHPRANSNDTMRREARVLAALSDTGVPHPKDRGVFVGRRARRGLLFDGAGRWLQRNRRTAGATCV